ncbi:MAG TPA: hypothetical protein VL401_01630 [Alphaproteobacteria bacterium]|jgi:hypothetical protein|nr:hypothetical protein [Alphaproteobacteria bacterium]
MGAWGRFIINKRRWDIKHLKTNYSDGLIRANFSVNPKKSVFTTEVETGVLKDTRIVPDSTENVATFNGHEYKKLPMNYATVNCPEESLSSLMYRGINNEEMSNIVKSGEVGTNGNVIGNFEPLQEGKMPTFFSPDLNTSAGYAVTGRTFDQPQLGDSAYVLEVKRQDNSIVRDSQIIIPGSVSASNIVGIIEIVPYQIHGLNFNMFQEWDRKNWNMDLNASQYWSAEGERANKYFYRKIEGVELDEFLNRVDKAVELPNENEVSLIEK